MEEHFDMETMIPKNLRDYVSEQRENGMFLSEYQIGILKHFGFSYQKYGSIKELLFDIEEYLNSNSGLKEIDALEGVSREISEREYYSHTNQ